MKLTESQIKFILSTFFILDKYPGSKSIGENLINTGSCIVAGNECIWKGGVGNFIQTKQNPNTIGCLEYKFDLCSFLESNWF
jgi:hypothetical protein